MSDTTEAAETGADADEGAKVGGGPLLLAFDVHAWAP